MTRFLSFVFLLLIFSCSPSDHPDLVLHNAAVYANGEVNSEITAVASKAGKIVELGTDETILSQVGKETEVIDARKAFLIPGFIEGHGHFYNLGKSIQNLNFLQSESWQDIVAMVKEKAADTPTGDWIEGRGWHQEKWNIAPPSIIEGYPTATEISMVSSENPIILYHASGHSLFANTAAMKLAGISQETPDPAGGRIVRDEDGEAIGVFEERAMNLIQQAYQTYLDGLSPEIIEKKWQEAIELAEEECLKKGITSFQDAGSRFSDLDGYLELANAGELDLRIWAMVRHSSEEMDGKLGKYKTIGAGNDFFTCNAIKSEVDGALGAFGAWLLKPYSDKPGFVGQNTTDILEVKKIAELAQKNDMQMCVHAIGDRANRVVVDLYEAMLKGENDKRWRIEHAQHLDPTDIPRFAANDIIASMQGVHCTSDAPFVEKRLGLERSKQGAYAWRSLLDAGVIIANGTDAPVEDVDPIKSYYASVSRSREDGSITFFPEQAMTRKEALDSYTIGNAFAAFEDDIKGSIEVGKYADYTLLSQNLLSCKEEDILNTKVLATIVNGDIKHSTID